MRIGIVLHPFDEEKPTGLGRFIYELTEHLLEVGTGYEFLLFSKKKPKTEPAFSGKNWKFYGEEGGVMWLDNVLKKNPKADVYIFNTPIMPFFFKPKKSVVIALDFAYVHLPSHSLFRWMKNTFLFYYQGFSLNKATHIVATSHATKEDVMKLFHIPEAKITVIYPGFVSIASLKEKKVNTPQNYFYYVGVIKERKNVFNMVKAFILFKEVTDNDYKFLIAGNNSGRYYESIVQYVKEKGREKDVIFLGYVSDEESAYLYLHAKAFIFTTLIEGAIGMPVLEAMEGGVPVITSDSPTFRELGTSAALAADPLDPADIAEKMQIISSDEALRTSLIKEGRLLARRFNWRDTAGEFLRLIQSL